jgi:rubrerythrin
MKSGPEINKMLTVQNALQPASLNHWACRNCGHTVEKIPAVCPGCHMTRGQWTLSNPASLLKIEAK